ncbi:Protein transport protein yif1 [Galdieria sulphuraria]|nr:Protein transport protein yif1 [Galdieria sulphuraria]
MSPPRFQQQYSTTVPTNVTQQVPLNFSNNIMTQESYQIPNNGNWFSNTAATEQGATGFDTLVNQQAIGATFARLGVQYGSHLLHAGGVGKQEVQEVTRWLRLLKYYFLVNNQYVLHKLALVVAPWLNKTWLRRRNTDVFETANISTAEEYLPPSEDVNAPDLYIPIMLLVTYILLGSLVRGTRGEFTPEIMGSMASSCLASIVLEVLLVKLGLFLIGSKEGAWLDLVAYSGYQFVGLVFTTVVGLLFHTIICPRIGSILSSFVLFYSASMMALFLMRTYRRVIHTTEVKTHGVVSGPSSKLDSRKNYFLLAVAILQYPLFWMLRTRL